MFSILNHALTAQAVLLTIMLAFAYVERTAQAYDSKDSTFFRTYTLHLSLQALTTFMALIVTTYLQDSWKFELKTSFPWIFGTAGVAVVTFFISHKFWSSGYEAA